MIRNVIFATAIALSVNVNAEADLPKSGSDFAVHVGGLSYHFNKNDRYNNTNWMLVAEKNQWLGGVFRNSYGEWTGMAGYALRKDHGSYSTGILVGATYGYREGCKRGSKTAEEYAAQDRAFCPLFAPYVQFDSAPGPVKPVLTVTPSAITLSGRIEF